VIAPKLTSIMCRPWHAPEPPEDWQPSRYNAFLVGPGWGLGKGQAAWLEALLPLSIPGVIDADGLTLLGSRAAARKVDLGGRWVLTPHPAEFSRLTGAARDSVLDDPVGHALAASERLNAVVVLKGHTTVVANTDGHYWILDGANPALATGGSGDVLAGLIAGGIAGGLSPVDAARFGVSLHASVGLAASRRQGWFLAEDLLPLISRVLWK
ncbi:MAG TPA: ADP/ATP-dependent (S)-NAD(P)H-hydrate dehydratase, partial [bacterium]|nr:ADP/ATP-dependent (S)-NAD(P)H-hydrate dehydratase [bacterium]